MALYDYKATDSSGKFVSGTMEAADEPALVDRLQELGYFPVKFRRSSEEARKGALTARLGPLRGPVTGRKVASFTHELSSMLEAGIPLDRSLSVLAGLEAHPAFKSVILDIHRGIRGGHTFAECLERHPGVFPDIYVNTVRAGEAGGALDEVLRRVSRFMEDTERLKDEVRSALLYPLLLTAVGGSAVTLMVLFVIPKFSMIFEDIGGVMPLPARMLLGFSETLAGYWWTMVIIPAALFFALKRRLRTEEGRVFFDGLKLRLPLIGPVFRKAAVSRFSRTLGMLLQGGLPILEALNISVRTIGNSSMAREISPVIDGVRRGRGVSAPLREAASFPPLAVHMLTVGEETGRLDEMLMRLADNYDREIGVSVKRLLSLLEPLIILVMALVVGFIVISLLLAVFSLNDMPL